MRLGWGQPCSWANAGPAQDGWAGPGSVFFLKKKKNKLAKKYCFGIFLQFPRVFVTLFLINIGLYFYVIKNIKSSIKIPGFHQNFQNTKNFEKNVFVHTAKCLEAKKSYCVFYTPKKQCFSMHFGFNNQFIKVKRTLAKISINNKEFYFVLSFSIRGTILHVIRIPNIKSFSNVRTVRFYPIKIRTFLVRRVFLEF